MNRVLKMLRRYPWAIVPIVFLGFVLGIVYLNYAFALLSSANTTLVFFGIFMLVVLIGFVGYLVHTLLRSK